jgi:hypothetical protein
MGFMNDSIYNMVLLELIEEMIEEPFASLDYDQPVEDVILEVDGYIEGYILASRKLVEYQLTQSYWEGVDDATGKLNAAAEQLDIEYNLWVPDNPEKLERLIHMHQRNVEDYALVLRGRLRSVIEAYFYMD